MRGLPGRPAPLIGRETEVAAVCALLREDGIALLTLVGPGGVGKTSLAVRVAAELAAGPRFADGAVFVPLAALAEAQGVLPAVAGALDLRGADGQAGDELLRSYLRAKRLLLVLDNCEQVLAVAPTLGTLLDACPGLKVLATSRAAFHLPGEQEFPVAPLALPPATGRLDAADLQQHPATQLFVARARAVRPEFAPGPDDAAAIAAICARLDGLPLAIELAAARSKLLSPAALLKRLADPLLLLVGTTTGLAARQQTMRATIAWSYGLLAPQEQALFRHLAVFAGGGTLEAVEAVGAGALAAHGPLLDLLAALVDQSLLQSEPGAGGEQRLAMLELIREYALAELAASGAEVVARRDHAGYFLAFAEQASSQLRGPEQGRWIGRLADEHENLRAALRLALDQGDGALALRLGRALWPFWHVRGHFREGARWLEEILAVPAANDPALAALRMDVLAGAGLLAFYQGDYGRTTTRCGEALALGEALGDARGQALALLGLAVVARNGGDAAGARTLHEQGLVLARACGDRVLIAEHLVFLGTLRTFVGEPAAARELLEEGLAISRALGDRRGIGTALGLLGLALSAAGDYTQADLLLLESLPIVTEVGDRRLVGRTLQRLGDVALELRDYAAAERWYREALAVLTLIGDRWFVSIVADRLAGLATAVGQPLLAARLFGVAAALRDALGVTVPLFNQARYHRDLAATRAALDEATFDIAWLLGRTQTIEEVLTQAGSLVPASAPAAAAPIPPAPVGKPSAPPATPDQLSPREVEVLRLVATGLTDAQVAEQLSLSTRTVNAHLRSIYLKLDLTTRSAATRWAAEHGLV